MAVAAFVVFAGGVIAQAHEGANGGQSPNLCLKGTGSRNWCGDGGRARRAKLAAPHDVALMSSGGYLIADTFNHVVRRVRGDGTIATVAGTGFDESTGDGGDAINAGLRAPVAVAGLRGGGYLVVDRDERVVRRVSNEGTIHTVAGGGKRSPPTPASELMTPRAQ